MYIKDDKQLKKKKMIIKKKHYNIYTFINYNHTF